MKPQRLTEQSKTIFEQAADVAASLKAQAILVIVEAPLDWEQLKQIVGDIQLVLAADQVEFVEGATDAQLQYVLLNMQDSTVQEHLTQAILESVADDILAPRSRVVAVYSGFEADTLDSISILRLGDHLVRLTSRDLRQLETSVPLDTLKIVVDVALDLGREGREGKPIGTMFVVGDARNVLINSRPTGFDPVRGYNRKERNLNDPRVREGIKEIAQIDGAFVVSADGTVEAAARYIDAPAKDITLAKGLGTRHWGAAAISRATKAVAVTVSESTGTVRLFQKGEVVLRIEPFRRPMKWKEFEYEPPAAPEAKSAG